MRKHPSIKKSSSKDLIKNNSPILIKRRDGSRKKRLKY
jgi:hypothetical protein